MCGQALSPRFRIRLFGRTAMNLDDKVCYCFHVSRRKLVNWVRLNHPKVPSQLSMCAGAGTGCGWCIPFLKQIFHQGTEAAKEPIPLEPGPDIETLSAEEYANQRAEYVKSGKGTPPTGAEPLPGSKPALGGEK
ncbi:MAG: BFD-like [2Fe-2S] binding domain protein [Gemmataceae bacterium]|nr:BFD-like [2Fe-2S] binding domain protein [Gemmataceae bacterium]